MPDNHSARWCPDENCDRHPDKAVTGQALHPDYGYMDGRELHPDYVPPRRPRRAEYTEAA